MRSTHLMPIVLLVPLLSGASCRQFTKDDAALLWKYDGMYIPGGEGPGHYLFPVDAIIFDSEKRPLTDEDFAKVFPAIKRMDPHRLHLRGQNTMGDQSIGLLNQLRSLGVLDTSGTDASLEGLKKLKVHSLKQLYISPDDFTEAHLQEIQEALPGVKVSRFRT